MGPGDMMARAQAAQGMMRGGAEMGEELPPEAMLPEEEMAAAAPPMDLESWLAAGESVIGDQPPEKAEEIRTHMNAIREIAAGGGEKTEPAPEEAELEELAEGATPAEAELPPEMPT